MNLQVVRKVVTYISHNAPYNEHFRNLYDNCGHLCPTDGIPISKMSFVGCVSEIYGDSFLGKRERNIYMTIEQNFAKLEETLALLESEEVTLEEAFAAYSEGMKLLKLCNEQIDRVEKQVLKLSQDGSMEALD